MLVFKSKDGRIIKFNPYHGKDGRFTSANGATSFTIRSKSGLAWDEKNVANAIEREKKRTAEKTKQAKPKEIKSYADVKSKQDFVDYVEHRHNLKLNNDKGDILNRKRDVLYTNIPKEKKNTVLNDFKENGIRYEEHLNGNYWIYFKSGSTKNSGSKAQSNNIESMQSEFDKLGNKMQELARYALPGQNYNESKAAEYYSVKNKRDELRRKINDSLAARVKNKQEPTKPKKFVNGYGEATDKYIATSTYERAMRRQQKEVDDWFGTYRR